MKGQMLIEIVVAVAIIALVLVGVSDLLTRSSKAGTFQKQRDEAIGVVQKKLNDYRVQRDTDPEGFYQAAASATLDPCEAGKPYVCIVTVNKTADAVMITVRAEWDEGGQTYNVSLSQSLVRAP